MNFRLTSCHRLRHVCCAVFGLLLPAVPLLRAAALPSRGESEGGLVVLVPAPEADVLQAVNEVASDQIIHGTYVYEKEKNLTGAHKAVSSAAFKSAPEPGQIFYKIAEKVLDPRHFKDSNDIGTITVRYIVQNAGPSSTNLRIDAVFLEDGRHKAHRSDGSVESAEYDAINHHLLEVQSKQERERDEEKHLEVRAVEPQEQKEHTLAMQAEHGDVLNHSSSDPGLSSATGKGELEKQVDKLRHQVEMRTKADGVSLKSAPFRRASTVEALRAHTEIVVLILTPYWYGVETADQHRGWIRRSELEPLP